MRIKLGFALLLLLAGGVFAQPVASKITVGSPDANYLTAVTGAAGAVEANADVILLTLDSGHYATTRAAADGDGPITFTVAPPPAPHDVQLTYTTTMPGFILEEGTTSALTYTYDAPRLAIDFPNLDLIDHDQAGGAGVITISLLLSGTDAAGKRQHAARTIVIAGEELQMPAQPPVASPARRRAAK